MKVVKRPLKENVKVKFDTKIGKKVKIINTAYKRNESK